MNIARVVLADGTVGSVVVPTAMDADDLVGLTVTVKLWDENGNPLFVEGEVREVL